MITKYQEMVNDVINKLSKESLEEAKQMAEQWNKEWPPPEVQAEWVSHYQCFWVLLMSAQNCHETGTSVLPTIRRRDVGPMWCTGSGDGRMEGPPWRAIDLHVRDILVKLANILMTTGMTLTIPLMMESPFRQ